MEKSVDMIASDLIFAFRDSQDRLDTISKFYGVTSIDYKEALEEHMEKFTELKNLVSIGLQHK